MQNMDDSDNARKGAELQQGGMVSSRVAEYLNKNKKSAPAPRPATWAERQIAKDEPSGPTFTGC